jgi:drug/metabolite transporter (DMT)-like permease
MIFVAFSGVYLLSMPLVSPFASTAHLSQATPSNAGPANGYEMLYVILGLLSGLAASVVYVTIRAIKHRESPLTIIFYFTFISTIGSLFFLFQEARWPQPKEWIGLLGVAVGSFYGQIWMTVAFRKAPASLVSPFSYLTPAFSFLAGFLFWNEPFNSYTLLGTGLIFVAGFVMSLQKTFYE